MPLAARYGGIAATGWIVAMGSMAQMPLAWLDRAPHAPSTLAGWGSLLALEVGCTAVAYALWNRGLERIEASRAGVYLNLEPVVGAALGITLMGDPMSAGLAGGGALVLGASLLASVPARRRPTRKGPERASDAMKKARESCRRGISPPLPGPVRWLNSAEVRRGRRSCRSTPAAPNAVA